MYSKGDQIPGAQQIAYLPPPHPSQSPPSVEPPQPSSVQTPPPPSKATDPTQDRELVAGVQAELRRLGLLDSADGSFGPKTRTAISNYQRIKGLAIDGVPSFELLNSLQAN
jgi:peptidoglycan hydrolase-like protein with peptidoglycan-binding domain